jgi:hypothetical protein
MHHEKNWELRRWVEKNRPDIWRKVRRCEARREQRRYHERNMNPERIRARIQRFGKVLRSDSEAPMLFMGAGA